MKKCQIDLVFVQELASWEEEYSIPSLLLLPPALISNHIFNAASEPLHPVSYNVWVSLKPSLSQVKAIWKHW